MTPQQKKEETKAHPIYSIVEKMMVEPYSPGFEVRDRGHECCIYILGTGEWLTADSLDALLEKLIGIVCPDYQKLKEAEEQREKDFNAGRAGSDLKGYDYQDKEVAFSSPRAMSWKYTFEYKDFAAYKLSLEGK